jgi:ribosomal protein S21
MKKNHAQVAHHIQQALRVCGEDFALEEARRHLRRAMNSIGVVAEKRQRRNVASERFAEEAKRNNEKWWKQIRENIQKSLEANLESKSTSSSPDSP